MNKDLQRTALACLAGLALAGCTQKMGDQPRLDPLESSKFFADGSSARHLVEGTVPRGRLELDDHLYAGRVDGRPATDFPFPVTEGILRRGRERFDIFCSPCHSRVGDGLGMIVRRGFRQPPSYHIPRLREAPPGHFFGVMTNGFGVMPAYGPQIPAEDRWAIVAYIRALQFSQDASLADVPAEKRAELEALRR